MSATIPPPSPGDAGRRSARSSARRPHRGDLHRFGRRRQDHHRGGARHGGRPPRAPGLRRHHRPGPPAGRRHGPRGAHRHPRTGRRALARGAVGDDARHQVDLRRPRADATPETPEQAEAILDNRFYRNISGSLSGTQEYMAMEKLYELHDEERLRPRRGRHAAHPQRPRLPRRAAPAHPLPRPPALPGPGDADPRPGPGGQRGRPDLPPHDLAGRRRPRSSQDAIAFFAAFDGMEAGLPRAGRRRWPRCSRADDDRVRARHGPPTRRRRGGHVLRRQARRGRHRRAGPDRQPGAPPLRGGDHRPPCAPPDRGAARAPPSRPFATNLADFAAAGRHRGRPPRRAHRHASPRHRW